MSQRCKQQDKNHTALICVGLVCDVNVNVATLFGVWFACNHFSGTTITVFIMPPKYSGLFFLESTGNQGKYA